MKIESPQFTLDDVNAFMDGYRDRERKHLADRPQRVSDHLSELGLISKDSKAMPANGPRRGSLRTSQSFPSSMASWCTLSDHERTIKTLRDTDVGHFARPPEPKMAPS